VIKRATEITYTGDTSGQYSDTVALSATLEDDATGTPLAAKTVTFTVGTQTTSATTNGSGVAATTLTLEQPAGSVGVEASFAGDAVYAESSTNAAFEILAEDAVAAFAADNPVGVSVATPGGASGPFLLVASLSEDGDGEDGDLLSGDWQMTLVPVGPGSPVTGTLESTVPGSLVATFSFDGVPVNTYAVTVTDANGYYRVGSEDVLVVYDPSLGFTTGGGWFYWPGTDDKTNFGYTMRYNKKGARVRGSLLLIRHTDEGIYRVKSNALLGLALGSAGDPSYGWASFSGKATYREPTWPDPIGNFEFVVYVEDRTHLDAPDRFWIEVRDRDTVRDPDLSLVAPAGANAVDLEGGNLVVPHKSKGRRAT
jgi:hypothetical protein